MNEGISERISIEKIIALLQSQDKGLVDRLQTACNNYEIASRRSLPYMNDIRESFGRINNIYHELGMASPFALSYADLRAGLDARLAKIKELEKRRDDAHAVCDQIEQMRRSDPLHRTPLDPETIKKDEENMRIWTETANIVSTSWEEYRKEEEKIKGINEEEFNRRCENYTYLRELYDNYNKNKRSLEEIDDEMVKYNIAKELSGINVAFDNVQGKYDVMDESMSFFKDVSSKLGIEIIVDGQIIEPGKRNKGKDIVTDAKEPTPKIANKVEIDKIDQLAIEEPVFKGSLGKDIVDTKDEEINNSFKLVEELRKLNPTAKISFVRDGITNNIKVNKPINTLTLPAGFKYLTNEGLSNGTLTIPIIEEIEKVNVNQELPNMDKPNNVINNSPNVNLASKNSSRIASNQEFKVSKIRWAKMVPYIKSVITMTGIAGMAKDLNTDQATSINADLSQSLQKTYGLLVSKNNNERISEIENVLSEQGSDVKKNNDIIHKLKNKLINAWKVVSKGVRTALGDTDKPPKKPPMTPLSFSLAPQVNFAGDINPDLLPPLEVGDASAPSQEQWLQDFSNEMHKDLGR